MRTFIAALLAGAFLTAPALAQRDPGGGGMQGARERTTEDRSQRQLARQGMRQALGGPRPAAQVAQRPERREFRQERRQDRQQYRQERRDDVGGFRQERRDDRQGFRRELRDDRRDFRQGNVNRREFRRDRADDIRDFRRDRTRDVRDFNRDRRQDDRAFLRDRREDRRDFRRDLNRNDRFGWNGNRGGWNGRNDGWNRDWRRDRRYDWQGWRQQNRGFYRAPRYYAPRGWGFGYRRFSLGVILSAPLFAQNYWINDPWQFRLPPTYGPYRWVRYFNDVVLVDIRDGRTVDVIYDFFW